VFSIELREETLFTEEMVALKAPAFAFKRCFHIAAWVNFFSLFISIECLKKVALLIHAVFIHVTNHAIEGVWDDGLSSVKGEINVVAPVLNLLAPHLPHVDWELLLLDVELHHIVSGCVHVFVKVVQHLVLKDVCFKLGVAGSHFL